MTTREPLSSVAVFGDQPDVWPVAAMLAANLPETAVITLVASADPPVDRPLVLPASHRFFDCVGLEITKLIANAGAAIGLGTDHVDWHGTGSSFFAAPSGNLPKINGVDLHQIMLHAAMQHQDTDRLAYLLEPFRFAAQTAKADRFAWPNSKPNSPTVLLGPQVQVGARALAKLLESKIPSNRVRVVQGTPVKAGETTDGNFEAVRLQNGESIAADLFVDLSGVLGALTETDGISDVAEFPFDRIASHFETGEPQNGQWHPVAEAVDGGLLIETPVQGGAFVELVFYSEALSEGDFAGRLRAAPVARPFGIQATSEPWTDNLVCMGSASASLGPYHSADALLLIEQITQLADLLPARSVMTSEAAAFNLAHQQTVEQIRDRVLAPFALSRRDDPAWSAMRQIDKPESLTIRLDQFASRGRVARFEGELFDEQSWIDLLIGCGVVPERCDPKALALDMQQLVPVMRRLAGDFASTIANLPAHEPPFAG